jgi:uncharacterized protein (DUF2141 family)
MCRNGLLTWMACLAAGVAATPIANAAKGGRVSIEITGLRSGEGRACAALYDDADSFPKAGEARKTVCASIAEGKASISFPGLAAGKYAVYAFHDEDADGVLKTNWIGMPKEGIGVSRGAKGFMGPPKFEDAAFDVAAGATISIRISLKYL